MKPSIELHNRPTLVQATCPVCAHNIAVPFYEGGQQPLAALGWPQSAAEAQAMPRHPQDFVQCPCCTHVWNRAFSYDAIPYQSNPNRMFNSGGIWKGYLATIRNMLLKHLPASPTVVEIGCGEGHFVRGLAQAVSDAGEGIGNIASHTTGRFVGFDPNASPETGQGVEFHARLFEPLTDMISFAPDAVVIRHVLEHLTEPAVFIEQLAWGAAMLGKPCWLFAEVPCIDRVFTTDRLSDFFYEHVAHFTTDSFSTLMNRAGEVIQLDQGYDGEVVYALVKLGIPTKQQKQATTSAAFHQRSETSRITIRAQLDALADSGAGVAVWGGTGKAAAFIHQFGVDAKRFPLVVDSDADKTSSYVPGSGQQIVFRDVLKEKQPIIVIIPSQWRALDIVAEMKREGILPEKVLIEHDGRLIDFFRDPHPYR